MQEELGSFEALANTCFAIDPLCLEKVLFYNHFLGVLVSLIGDIDTI